jgi:hypothetical protein
LLPVFSFLCLAASPYVPWEDLTQADFVYSLATRFAAVDGRQVHYPTPTAELSEALAARSEPLAQRHLAEARLALGDRAGAVAAITKWAESEGAEAWAEAARWCAAHHEWPAAFAAAQSALPALDPDARRTLADDVVRWADAHPEASDPLQARARRAELFPQDEQALEEWIRALERTGRIDAAQAALEQSAALPAATRLLIRSDLLADRDRRRAAFELLDAALSDGSGALFDAATQRAYALRVDQGAPQSPETWRAALDRAWDTRALVRLATYLQGQRRGDAAADLLRQVERRYESSLDRPALSLVARLWSDIDAVPEAFRARLAAAQAAGGDAQPGELAELARLALRAGGRALPWGGYNDESYRWVARLDRTPGFWTGGLSFLLTGQDWSDALGNLESESLPERTFRTARLLVDELARRAPTHAELPSLRAGLMARHVERGEGRQALDLLPQVEAGPPDVAAEGRRVALLAMRQVEVPLADELRLYRAQLRAAAPDGSRPTVAYHWEVYGDAADAHGFERARYVSRGPSYRNLLDEAVARLDSRDASHRTSLGLLLGELDRLPDAEALWLELAGRLEGWRLDDELGPRYERALRRFGGASWWERAARWYARHRRQAELRKLAEDVAARFRGSALFERAQAQVALEIPAGGAGSRVRLVPWADYVRLKALERFPHSPRVFSEALGRLLTREEQGRRVVSVPPGTEPVLVDAALVEERRAALLFVDPARREEFLHGLMASGRLEARLTAWEQGAARTPVEDRLLFDGWARLSQFERAAPAADRLAAAYPGDGALAQDALSLHRSLASLSPAHATSARAVVERTAPALEDPNALWTGLGELEQERGRGDLARETWAKLLEREPRDPGKVEELATLLWDYGYMREALDVVEAGRKRLERPRLLAFEAGVLHEELKDVEGAVREYLSAAEPDEQDCFCTWFEADQRALRRLSQLLARERVRTLVLRVIDGLRPGVRADEKRLVALYPLAQIEMPDDTLDFTADDWIDQADLPNDPVGRAQREAARADWRPRAREGFARIGAALLTRTLALVPRGSEPAFLDAVGEWQARLADARWGAGREVDLEDALRARRAELAPSREDRVALEVERARFLFERGRREAADALWAALAQRVEALPQGAPRLRAEAERAAYLERSRGIDAAAAEWQAITARYPWSRGLLDARLAFLARVGRGGEGRQLLEAVAPRAAAGHREALVTRLAHDALEARDLPQARRAVELLASQAGLDAAQRLGAVHLLARLRLREDSASDLVALAKEQGPRFEAPQQADLYAQLAGAADAEKQWGAALTLWIEALNRRLDRPWIRSAWRAAERGGRAEELRGFFETQQRRSPRDVRWAVAVRELRLLGHDLEGAITAAKAAVDMRPERESLWSEAAELLVRAGRPHDAADYLAGWARPRPADESVASWRSRLYSQAGAGARALEVERDALRAYEREVADRADEGDRLRGERKSRAARRLMDYGLPREALQLAAEGDVRRLEELPLDWQASADLAVRNGKLSTFLGAFGDRDDAREGTALTLSQRGRPEHKEEALRFVLKQLVPPLAAGKGLGPWEARTAALRRWWSFAGQAGIEPALRMALARRALESVSGPWSAQPPAALAEAVGDQIVAFDDNGQPQIRAVDLPALWVRHLVERDEADALGAFLSPHVAELAAQVMGTRPLSGACRPNPPRNWTRWLDDPAALETWVRWSATHPEDLAALLPAFRERRHWDRLWALGACGWNVTPLVAAVPDDTRAAWFRMWLNPSPQDADPVLRARGETLDEVGTALARLVTGAPGATGDALVAKLRGPRTVGDVLGNDPAWTWPEFTPRPGTRDDQVTGRGADAGRFPGELWGERPGQAWHVLETLARWRAGDATAARVPLEVAERGRESERATIAARLADRLGDDALALELSADYPAGAADLERLRAQLRRVRDAQGASEAQAALQAEVRRLQGSLSDGSFRNLAWLAEDLGLPGPLEALDPGRPLSSPLLAYVYERYGPAAGARFQARDAAEFRVALASRWAERERTLPADAVRVWLRELWAHNAAGLPRRGLRALGAAQAAAADWLEGLPYSERRDALDALDALPDTARLEALLGRAADPRSDAVRLMRVRVKLLQGDEAGALALIDEALGELRGDAPLAFQSVALRSTGADEESDEPAAFDEAEAAPAYAAAPSDPVAARLRAWLAPFEQAQRAGAAAARVRALLRERREGATSVPAAESWRLELELTPAGVEREALLRELEHGWIRGDWSAWSVAPIAEVVAAQAPAEAPRWIARLPGGADFDTVAQRARLLARIRDERGAAAELVAGRQAETWTPSEDVRAFDQWRRLGVAAATGVALGGARSDARASATRIARLSQATSDPAAGALPDTWSAALPFWRRPPGEAIAALGEHLRRHPFDILSARAALRSVAAADEEPLRLAEQVLAAHDDDGGWSDQQLLQTRRARKLLERSWRAANAAFAQRDAAALASELERRRLGAADVQATLADLARAATPAGDAGTAEAALAALERRQPDAAARLRAELRPLRPRPPLRPFQLAPDGAIRPLRPRTLDWPLVAAALAQETTP